MNYKDTKMYSEILQQPDVLRQVKLINSATIAEIVNRIKKEKIHTIATCARGSSDNACMYFGYLVEIFSKFPVNNLNPSVVTMYDGELEIKNNLVFGVSQSGKAADCFAVLERAKKCGSITVAVTNDKNSPLAKLAEYHIDLSAGVEHSVAATKTFVSQMYALLLIALELSLDPLLLGATQNIINGIRAVIDNVDNICKYSDRLLDTNSIFVLARGINFPIAKEVGLKLAETSYIKAQGWAVSDFAHGPFAMIDKSSTVLALAPQGVSQKEVLDMAYKCKAVGAKVIIIGTDNVSDCDLVIPSGTDIETAFYNVVTAQLLACCLSCKRGLNPDTPRGLNKVTITK